MIIINISNKYNKVVEETKEKKEQRLNTNDELINFSYTISHELKAPIRAIDGYSRIFIEDYEKQIDEDGVALIGNIRHICSDTLSLINKLLEYIQYGDMQPTKEMINLKELVKATFDELVIGYKEKDTVQLKFESELPIILCDNILMKQVIVNIISNSLKFTVNKEIALITVGYIYEDNENIFYIKDNGVGFDMKFSESLFGIFQRMHSEKDFEGSGVGLAIVKKIVQKFNGRVWITGEVEKGACTYFTIGEENILK